MISRHHPRGLTLVEGLLACGVLILLVALVWPVAAGVRRNSDVTTCTAHLRQLGLAYQLYYQEHGQYPEPLQLTESEQLRDRRILFCPRDTTHAVTGAASSYLFHSRIPPEFKRIGAAGTLDPNVVLVSCNHHLEQRTIPLKGDGTRTTPPRYPYRLVLRASGTVERIHADRLRLAPLPGPQQAFVELYPGEPGYGEDQ